jgi:uroporphyrinogen decarboxylase
VMLFDSWGGALTGVAYREFSLAYLQHVVSGLKRQVGGSKIPVILFTKGGGAWLEDIAATGCDAVGLDWTVDLAVARQRVGQRVALQGNFDPMALFGSPQAIEAEVSRLLRDFGAGSGHVFNLGHGISQHTPPENVAVLVDAVHQLSRPYHSKAGAL